MQGSKAQQISSISLGPTPLATTLWVCLGLGTALAYFLKHPSLSLEKPLTLVATLVLTAIGFDLFIGSSRRVSLQRISPAIILAILITPGIPAGIALVADLVATLTLITTAQATTSTVAAAGRSILPAASAALLLSSRQSLDFDTYLLTVQVFLVVSILTRSSEPPFRADVFLVASYPAIALMIRTLADFSLGYVLLSIPLLFLLTTVDTEMLLRYFRLKKELEGTQTAVKKNQRARQLSEQESRRKGILLERRERQLELLNGLGQQLEEAKASDDLGRFLLKECSSLIGADAAAVIFREPTKALIARIIADSAPDQLGLKPGDPLPSQLTAGFHSKAPWPAPLWQDLESFLSVGLGGEGWLFLASHEPNAFPDFLDDFFSAVGRHAGSSTLALRRLNEVRDLARREAKEKEKVAQEKEKVAQEKERVAEQNQNLRGLITTFDVLTEASLTSQEELLKQGAQTVRRLTGAEKVIFKVPALDPSTAKENGLAYEGKIWPSYLFLPGGGPSGNLLCLATSSGQFSAGHLEWCTLLRNFLDKTLENGTLHQRIKASLAKLKETQQEIIRSSQWAAAGRLAANAAHELNTPLGAIRLTAEQVKFFQGDSVPEPAKVGIESIIRSVDRCREVTDRLLITSRPVDQGELTSKPSSTSLLPIIRDALASVQPYLNTSKIKLASHRLKGDYQVFVILQDLYWAIVNIIKNSIDALNENEATQDKRIAVAVDKVGDMVEIKISDNGPGIPEKVRAKIFEPFFTTKKIGSGNGLGLALARQNLGKWGGKLSLGDDPVDGGACFIITVPLTTGSEVRRA